MPHILVVDDDDGIRETVRFALEDEGYTVDTASTGMQALAKIRATSEHLVVLIDYNMPSMTGLQVIDAANRRSDRLWERPSFILMTAYGTSLPRDVHNRLAFWHVPVIAKPFDLDELLDTVSMAADDYYGPTLTDVPRRAAREVELETAD